jgi:hypothetical protein
LLRAMDERDDEVLDVVARRLMVELGLGRSERPRAECEPAIRMCESALVVEVRAVCGTDSASTPAEQLV